jgi:hypothetical protein
MQCTSYLILARPTNISTTSMFSKQIRASKPKVRADCRRCKYATHLFVLPSHLPWTFPLRKEPGSFKADLYHVADYLRRTRRVKCDETKAQCLKASNTVDTAAATRPHSLLSIEPSQNPNTFARQNTTQPSNSIAAAFPSKSFIGRHSEHQCFQCWDEGEGCFAGWCGRRSYVSLRGV